jgi:rhodanese-related sulfurtransferase
VEINTISREDLKMMLDRGDRFKLVMPMGEWAFQAKHIPGSINLNRPQDGLSILKKDEEIVVYCSDVACFASIAAYRFLVKTGYSNVRRYEGGLADWEAAGYPLEGEGLGA